MQILLFLLIFIIGLGSLITSFVAIIQILSNDFKESKIQWILISMIAFIGPILWLTKGRKLIIKNGQSPRNENNVKISLSEHYTQLIKNIGTPLKILTLIALALILYGYLARALNIYFFWESKSIGFGLLLFAIAKFILDDINARRENKMHRIVFYIVFSMYMIFYCSHYFFFQFFTIINWKSPVKFIEKEFEKPITCNRFQGVI